MRESIERGREWGTEVAQAVLAWRATDGFARSYPAFTGGTAIGQWRPTPPAFGPMSAQGLAFTDMFVLVNNTQFQPEPPRTLGQRRLHGRLQRGQGARPKNRLDTHRRPDGTGSLLGRQRQRPLESGREPDRPRHDLSMSGSSRLLAVLNIAMADTAFTIWSAKRFYGSMSDRSDVAAGDGDSAGRDRWQSGHGSRCRLAAPGQYALTPEYPAGHPARTGRRRRCF